MNKYKNLWRVAYLSLGIILLYMAFNSTNNIESSILEDNDYGDLGFVMLAVLYISMGVGSLLSAAVIKKFGTRWCLIMGGIGTIIPILATLLPVINKDDPNFFLSRNGIIAILYIAQIINGVTVSILFTAAN